MRALADGHKGNALVAQQGACITLLDKGDAMSARQQRLRQRLQCVKVAVERWRNNGKMPHRYDRLQLNIASC